MAHGERLLVWAPMEIVGEPEDQSLICDVCEGELAGRIDDLIGGAR